MIGGSQMAAGMGGSRMTYGMGSRMTAGTQMAAGMGSVMEGSGMGTGTALINKSSMIGLNQFGGTGRIPGNPTKAIVNEDEMTVQGIHFVERKELLNDGIQSIVKHSRMIDDSQYEVVATIQDGQLSDLNVNTNLEDEEEVYMMEQLWYGMWGYDESLQQYGLQNNQASAMTFQGSRMSDGSRI